MGNTAATFSTYSICKGTGTEYTVDVVPTPYHKSTGRCKRKKDHGNGRNSGGTCKGQNSGGTREIFKAFAKTFAKPFDSIFCSVEPSMSYK